MTEEARYQATWQYIRRWEQILKIGFGILICIGLCEAAFAVDMQIGQYPLLAGSVCLLVMATLIQPECPRCGKKFFRLGLVRDGTMKDKCVHCGLPKGVPKDPEADNDSASK